MQYTKNQVMDKIIENGFEPLDFIWNGYASNIDFKDDFGYKYSVSWSYFNRNDFVGKPFMTDNPYCLDNMKNFIQINGYKCEILSTEKPKSITSKILFKGKCGHNFERDWSHYLRNDKELCPSCHRKEKPHRKRITEKQYVYLFEKYGFKILENLTDGKKRNNDTLIEVMDKNGYKGFLNYSNLQQRKEKCNFMPFSKFNKWSIYNIRHYFAMNGIKTKVISEQYNGCDQKIKFQCVCGEYFTKTFPNKRANYLCKKCNSFMSKLERTVMDYLEFNNIAFVSQKIFDDCRDKKPLPFDFYLPDKNICIEVQGEQHYFPIIFGDYSYNKAYENLLSQQKRDLIKLQYCEKNNIQLITLDYNIIRTNKYIDILEKI